MSCDSGQCDSSLGVRIKKEFYLTDPLKGSWRSSGVIDHCCPVETRCHQIKGVEVPKSMYGNLLVQVIPVEYRCKREK
jgi:hypothetical protein